MRRRSVDDNDRLFPLFLKARDHESLIADPDGNALTSVAAVLRSDQKANCDIPNHPETYGESAAQDHCLFEIINEEGIIDIIMPFAYKNLNNLIMRHMDYIGTETYKS